jgi:hypothetical protein
MSQDMSIESPYSHDTTAISEITGRPVSTWSEEWQHECEARAVLALSKSDREAFFNGSRHEEGRRKERGIIAIRGQAAADTLRGYMERLQEARARKKG